MSCMHSVIQHTGLFSLFIRRVKEEYKRKSEWWPLSCIASNNILLNSCTMHNALITILQSHNCIVSWQKWMSPKFKLMTMNNDHWCNYYMILIQRLLHKNCRHKKGLLCSNDIFGWPNESVIYSYFFKCTTTSWIRLQLKTRTLSKKTIQWPFIFT